MAAAKPLMRASRSKGLASRQKPLTAAKKRRFLELICEGKNRAEAADAIGEKGSRFRAMVREGTHTYDADFAARYAEARVIADEAIDDLLDAEGLRRQLGSDPATKTDRGLHNERIYRSPKYRAAHRPDATLSVVGDQARPVEVRVTHDPALIFAGLVQLGLVRADAAASVAAEALALPAARAQP